MDIKLIQESDFRYTVGLWPGVKEEFIRLQAENKQLRETVEDMCCQYGGWSTKGGGGLTTDGMSALEGAFGVLGWVDPHPRPDMRCDEPGCKRQRTCGTPTKDGYRSTCGEHAKPLWEALEAKEKKP